MHKPQTKKKESEEGKGKKAVMAVAAALLLLAVAAFVHAQSRGNASKVVEEVKGWTLGGLDLVATLFGVMFWAAVGIAIFHVAMSYLAPGRHHRFSAMWDAIEKAKDIATALGVMFAVFYGVIATAAVISGDFSTDKAFDLFFKIVTKPIQDLYDQIRR